MSTPADLQITPRDLRLERQARSPRWWANNDPAGTAVMNALSLSFPDGERFFIQAVRRYEKQAPEALRPQIRAFVTQEAMHTREHMAFNEMIEASGYDTAGTLKLIDERLEISRSRPPLAQLAATVALEHFTATFAHRLLTRPELLSGAPEEAGRLWRWHAIEEIEHKSVAYDLFMHVIASEPPLKRWYWRVLAMGLTTLYFTTTIRRASLLLMKQDGFTGLKARWRLWRWLWLRPGLYRMVLTDAFSFYQPGFHPWQKDDRALIADAEARLAL